MKPILPNFHQLKLGAVNAYLIDHGGLTLIDTGYPGNEEKIFGYLKKIGKKVDHLENIIATHVHTDHTGSLAALKKASGATVYMHPDDAELLEKGQSFREKEELAPGLLNKLVYRFFIKNAPRTVEPVAVDRHLHDGDHLDIGAGLRVYHVSGHCKGQIALLYQDHGGLLIAADTAGNIMGLSVAPFYENLEQGYRDLDRLGALEFDAVVFGHGNPVIGGAAEKFRKKLTTKQLKPEYHA